MRSSSTRRMPRLPLSNTRHSTHHHNTKHRRKHSRRSLPHTSRRPHRRNRNFSASLSLSLSSSPQATRARAQTYRASKHTRKSVHNTHTHHTPYKKTARLILPPTNAPLTHTATASPYRSRLAALPLSSLTTNTHTHILTPTYTYPHTARTNTHNTHTSTIVERAKLSSEMARRVGV